ncbi:hypothetical protein K0M31_012080 [Melipona bicolor]|uniref:Uncharacterized protein n=1 Tax=Melipona bicolor TaxID=60889 RepID=A0AA40KVD2_9HYME|nr:hypothetical protein K0M31_012080 [Melipona bicolor]
MDFQNHTVSRPKFQPLRVKELLHFCESDDDESEDRPQDSDNESDFDDVYSLPQDDYVEDNLNMSLPLLNTTCNESEETRKVSQTVVYSKSQEFEISNSRLTACKSERSLKCEQSNQVQLNIETSIQDNFSQIEHKNKCITNVNSKGESSQNEFLDQQNSSQVSNSKKSIASTSQHLENMSQSGIDNLQNINKKSTASTSQHLESISQSGVNNLQNISKKSIASTSQHLESISQSGIDNLQNISSKKETLESTSMVNEEKIHCENVSSTSKTLISDTGTYINSIDQRISQSPLKHAVSSSRPDPCFSRRNITQTPQNKCDISKNHGLTPATILSHWSQNNMKQTPLQNKSINFKDSTQTPKNSFYFTSTMGKHETPRYICVCVCARMCVM